VVGALVLIGAATASLLLARKGDAIQATRLQDAPAPTNAPAEPTIPVVPAPAAPTSAVAPGPAAASAAQELVTLHVTTRPSGAKLRLSSGGELCGRTPCSFEVVRGAQVSLLARYGQRRAATTLTPQATADVHIVLDAPSPTKGERRLDDEDSPHLGKSGHEAEPASTDELAADDDFKTPEVFK
jgi:hypothetical protein